MLSEVVKLTPALCVALIKRARPCTFHHLPTNTRVVLTPVAYNKRILTALNDRKYEIADMRVHRDDAEAATLSAPVASIFATTRFSPGLMRFEARGYANERNARRLLVEAAEAIAGHRNFVAVQDGRYYPVVVMNNDGPAINVPALCRAGIVVVN